MAALLITAGIVLIALNIKAALKKNNSFDKVLKNKEDNMQEYEVEIGKLRKEFAETIFDMQKDMESLKGRLDSLSEKELQYEVKINSDADTNINTNTNTNTNIDIAPANDKNVQNDIREGIQKIETDNHSSNNIKTAEVDKMIKEGFSDDEIAEKMKIGKGEVLLIKGLYLK